MEANKVDNNNPIIAFAEAKVNPKTGAHKCLFYGTFSESQTDAKAQEIMKTRTINHLSDNGLVYFFD